MCFAKSLVSNNKLFQGHPVFLGYWDWRHRTRREKLHTVAEGNHGNSWQLIWLKNFEEEKRYTNGGIVNTKNHISE